MLRVLPDAEKSLFLSTCLRKGIKESKAAIKTILSHHSFGSNLGIKIVENS